MALEHFKYYKIKLNRADMTIATPLTPRPKPSAIMLKAAQLEAGLWPAQLCPPPESTPFR